MAPSDACASGSRFGTGLGLTDDRERVNVKSTGRGATKRPIARTEGPTSSVVDVPCDVAQSATLWCVAAAPRFLRPGGWLCFEVGLGQGKGLA
ncbi:MAG: hypothetical protein ACJ8AO_20410, partial [Gemmatimonadaceae bacterium]